MFSKAFRVKSNTAIKGSDRRKLRTDVAAAFPALSSEQLSEVVPNREELNIVKLYTHKGDAVTVYANNRNPVLFEMEKTLYPTDLMLPGVMVPSCGLPQVQQGTLCAITLVGNRAPVAVGVATMPTAEMLAAGMKGKGFTVLHAYTDHLWGFGDKSYPPTITPLVAEPAELESTDEDDKDEEGREPGNDLSIAPSLQMDIGNLNLQEGDVCARLMEEEEEPGETGAAEMAEDIAEVQPETEDGRTPQERMDELLHQCFVHALKCKVKKSELPLLTSTFLRNHMVSCCPEGQQLDLKKSSYKKLSKFLQYMQQQKIVQVKELNRGVESIVHIDWKHSDIKSFVVPEAFSAVSMAPESKCGDGDQLYHPPEIIPLYGVSTKMAPLFQESGHKKGSILSSSDVRSIIISYVKTNELVDETNKKCLDQMQPYHQVTFFGHEPIVRKGNLDPIDITIAQRSSNKKVTIIKNLELYGLDPQLVANTLQQRVQASATINTLPGAKDRVQVQIQGNQINHLAKLLLEEYQLHRKYIQGLEKAPKPTRKK
ncbi:Eukaryotic translation initiation factor 2D [Chelonia mydas]|uniref:Eukaryotic translation initiation factor 2D n=1 Tax=Chelonia mydas TaxID=8469 RepID=M7B1B9_CHEMY|nr:Eukaryotic translation initiation factor 2D [Chelonia mydas]